MGGWVSGLAAPLTDSVIQDPGSLHVSALSSSEHMVPPCSCSLATNSKAACALLLVPLMGKRDWLLIAQQQNKNFSRNFPQTSPSRFTGQNLVTDSFLSCSLAQGINPRPLGHFKWRSPDHTVAAPWGQCRKEVTWQSASCI